MFRDALTQHGRINWRNLEPKFCLDRMLQLTTEGRVLRPTGLSIVMGLIRV